MIGTGIGLGLSGYRLAPGNWNPSRISGLQLWLDASDSSTLFQSSGGSAASEDGDPVGYWLDKSSSSRNATQTSGVNKPTLKTNILNGKPVIRFDGNDRFSLGISIQSEPRTIAIVYKKTSTVNSFIALGHSSNGETGDIIDWTDGSVYSVSSTKLGYSSSGQNTSFVVFVTTIDATQATFTHRKNASSQTVTTGPTSGTSTIDQIGARVTSYGRGDIAELIAYDSALSLSDRQAVENYLNTKWSVY